MKTTRQIKGHSRKCTLGGKIRDRIRRFLSVALSVSMVACSMPAIPVYAEPINEDDEVQEFTLTSADISAAIRKAMQGEPIDEDDYGFAGAEAAKYEELFFGSEQSVADVYELFPKFEKDRDGSLSLRVFLRMDLEGDRELDSDNEFTGEEDLIFLLLNNGKEEQTARIYVDENMSGLIDVAPRKDVVLDGAAITDTTEEEAEGSAAAQEPEEAAVPSGTVAPAGGGAGGGASGGSGAAGERYEADEEEASDEAAEAEDAESSDEAEDTDEAEAAVSDGDAAEAETGDTSDNETADDAGKESGESADKEDSSDASEGSDSSDSESSDNGSSSEGESSEGSSDSGSDSASTNDSGKSEGSSSDGGNDSDSSDSSSDSNSDSSDSSRELSYSNHKVGTLMAPGDDDDEPEAEEEDDDADEDDADEDADIVIDEDDDDADEGLGDSDVEILPDDDSDQDGESQSEDIEDDAETVAGSGEDEADAYIQIEPEADESYITVEALASDEDVAVDTIVVVASDSDADEASYKLVKGEVLNPVIVKKKNKTFAGVAYTAKIADLLTPAEGDTLTYEGEDYTVKVTYGDDASLPYGVSLEVSEYEKDSDTYRERILEAADMYGWDEDVILEELDSLDADDESESEDFEEDESDECSYVDKIRIFDISLTVDDEIVEPATDVEVEFTFEDQDDEAEYKIIHFMDDKNEEIDTETAYEDNAQVVTFSVAGFSDFMVVDSGIMPLEDDNEADLYITYAGIELGASGTAPFDDDDENGNDSSVENDIIRSFDRATYNMDLDIDSKAQSSDANAVRIHFEVSIQGSDIENEFYTQGFSWADHYELTETDTGHTITGYYDYKRDGGVTGGEISGLTMVVQVLAMSDGMILQPVGKVWLEELDENGNGTEKLSETVDLNFPALEVSAALQLNVYLYQGNTAQTSVEGTFDFATGGEGYINYDKGTSIYGRTYGYGITLEMYDQGNGKGMKGQALPDGDKINLTINLNSTFDVATDYGGGTLDLSTYDDGNYQLLFYALEGNKNNNSTCDDGRSLISEEGEHPSEYYSNHVPLNKPTNASTQLGVTAVEDGGNWKAVSQTVAAGGTTINIQVDSYKITELLFPYAYPNNSNATDGFYTKGTALEDIGRAVFSAGEIWVIQPYSYVDKDGVTHELSTEAGKGTFTIQVKDGVVDGEPGTYVAGSYDSYDQNVQRNSDGNITAPLADENGNIDYGGKETKSITEQVHNTDDSKSQTAEINPPGSFQNKIKYISTAKKNGYTNVQGVLGDTTGTSYATLGYDDVSISGGLQYTPNTRSNISAALNAVIKFDANALSIKDDNWLSFVRYDGLSNDSDDYNIFFGYLDSGENWESDTAMQEADEDDLNWYSTRQSDKLCVAVLFEYRKPGTTTGDTRLRPSMAMNVLTDSDLAGNVYMTTEVTRVWTVDDVAELYNKEYGTSITYNDVIDDESCGYTNAVIPSAAGNYYASHSTDELPAQSQGYGSGYSYNTHQTGTIYQKTSYNADGTRTGHNGGDYYGDSLLILSYTSDVNLRIAQEASDQQTGATVDKSIYNFDNAERIADLEVTGSMEIQESVQTESWGDTIATVTVTLPEGTAYKVDSAKYGIADSSGNFSITYTQPTTQGQEGSVSGGSVFVSTTSEAEYQAWLANEDATGGMLYISTDSDGNQVLTFSVKGVPIQGTDVVRIYFSVELGNESDPDEDLGNNSSLTFNATIRTTEDSDRETTADNGNKDSTTILISRTGSNTFSKTTPTALLNEQDDELTWIITWDNTSLNNAADIEILDDMPDTKDSYSEDYPYASDYHGTYAITEFKIDMSQISAKDVQKLVVYYTMDSQYEGDELVLEHDGDESKLDITWDEIKESWEQLTVSEDGSVDFSSIYTYEYDSTGKITAVTNHVYAWAIGGTVPAGEGVHITLTVTQYGGEGGDYMTNVAYDSTGNSVFHRSSTVYKVIRSISGIVWLDEDMDGSINQGKYKNEQMISGAEVQLQVKNGDTWDDAVDVYGETLPRTTQYGTGYYEFTNLPAGTYRLIFSDYGSSRADPNYKLADHELTKTEANGILTAYNSKAVAPSEVQDAANLPSNAVAVIENIVLPEKDDMSIYEHTYTEAYQNAGFTKAQTLDVSKTWIDANGDEVTEGDGIGEITANVTINTNQTDNSDNTWSVVLNAANNWTDTINDLWYYDGTGQPIEYELNGNVNVTEDGKPDNYDFIGTEWTGDATSGYSVMLKNSEESVEISGEKAWVDDDNQDGKRPESITINLMANGEPALDKDGNAITATVTPDNHGIWSWSFTDLPKYADGKEIEYTVIEETIDGYTPTYTVTEDGYYIINTHRSETIDIEGSKTWDDNNNQDGKRPESITIRLWGDGAIVETRTITPDENGTWSWSFTNLPKYNKGVEIVYNVTEDIVPDYSTTYSDEGYDVINKHTPEQRSLTVLKVWDDSGDQDGKRPDDITVTLVENGEPTDQTLTLNKGNSWTGSFTNLDVYTNGVENVYTVQEETVADYTTEILGDGTIGYVIVNTHIPELTNVNGEKTWDDEDDQDGIRPAYITVRLYADGNEIANQIVVGEGNSWSWSFNDLPKYKDGIEITYTITEDAIDGYETTYSEDGYDIINSHEAETLDIEGSKTWNDNDDQDGKRPTEIIIHLLRDDEEIDQVVVTEEDDWSWIFTDLPKYHNHGQEYVYTIKEVEVEGYSTEINGYDVINGYIPETVDVSGSKIWDDADNQDGKRPAAITIHLLQDEVEIDSVIVTEEDNWTWSFTDLPKYHDHGQEYVYTITEDEVSEYTTEIDGYDVTNSHIPETIDIEGNKTWNDADDQDGIRPESITVNLMDGEDVIETYVATPSDASPSDWSWGFTDLPKYKDGVEIDYKVEEIVVNGYTTTISELEEKKDPETGEGTGVYTITITNSHKPETIDINGTKVWVDNEYDDIRPDEITVNLFADEAEEAIRSVTVTRASSSDWSWSFTELPKYRDGGIEIIYTVTEDPVYGYTTVIDGYNITNYHAYFPIDEEIVTDPDDIFNETGESYTKAESVNEYNKIEIEMTTHLPILDANAIREGNYILTFHDELDSELRLDESDADFAVYIGGNKIRDKYYEVIIDPNKDNSNTAPLRLPYDSPDICDYHVEVDLSQLAIDGVITEDDLQGDTEITLFFYVDLEGTGLNGSYTSTIWYDIYDGDEWKYTAEKDVVSVYTYEIEILKYDSFKLKENDYDAAALAGATLGVYYDKALTDPVLRYYTNIKFEDEDPIPLTATSDENGRAIFYGLAEGDYFIAEIAAPEGYKLSEEVLPVTISAETTNEDHLYSAVFANEPDEKVTKSVNIGDGTSASYGSTLEYTITFTNERGEDITVEVTDTLDDGLNYVEDSASDNGVYDPETRTITWKVSLTADEKEGSVSFKATVNSTGRSNRSVSNYADVDYGHTMRTNTVTNPVPTGSSGRSGGGGGGGSGSGGGSGAGGPGSGGSSGEGDSGDSTWDLLPLPQTGEGWAMLIGACALAVSAMALAVLLFYKRRESRK